MTMYNIRLIYITFLRFQENGFWLPNSDQGQEQSDPAVDAFGEMALQTLRLAALSHPQSHTHPRI